jgi:hypothetical protein
MPLYLAALLASPIFEQPAGGIECITNRDMGILMRMMGFGIAANDDLAARNSKLYTHLEQVALLAARVAAFDDDATGDDPIREALELFGASADTGG